MSTLVTIERPSRNRWLIARAYIFAKHEAVLEEVLSSVSGLDFELLKRPFLGIQGLTETDFVMLKLACPRAIFAVDEDYSCLVEDHHAFTSAERSILCIGSHLACARIIIADIAIRNWETFKMLKTRLAEQPSVFEGGLQLLEARLHQCE